MPLYEYQCVKCHRRTEKIESLHGPHLKKCPHCKGKVERLQSSPAIQFKGSGWYVTDYAGKGGEQKAATEKGEAKEPAKETAKDSAAKETKEKKTAKKD